MDYQLIFRSKYGQLSAIAVLGVALVFVAMVWSSDGPGEALRSLMVPIGLVYFTWWIWAWPHVTADKRGITVYNQLRTFRISWKDFASAESRFGLYLSVYKTGETPSADVNENPLNSISRSWDATSSADWDAEEEPTRRIYAAGVPARGGFAASRKSKPDPAPVLKFSDNPRITVRVEPHTAAQLLEEEKLYFDNPDRRPLEYRPSTGQSDIWEQKNPATGKAPYTGVKVSFNWLLVSLIVICGAAIVFYGVTF